MQDPLITIGRILMLVFPPFMILVPLVTALLAPQRATEESARARQRGLHLALVAGTMFSLAVWGTFVLLTPRFASAQWAAMWSWPLFFPLWFGLAWPLIRAKSPHWEGAMYGAEAASGAVRTASLVNRERLSPVTRWMWAVALLASVAGVAAIAARGLMPFPLESVGSGDEAAATAQRTQWWIFLGLSLMGPLGLLWLPRVLRAMLREPEPMDAAGSRDLAELYAAQRRRRVLGMFWLNGVAGPLVLGGIFALVTWFPNSGAIWGIIGGVGGTALGITGAVFGFMMTAERAKIAEARARLERSSSASAG
ncbi:MAG: hypothetical protein GC172_04180 [Phycisphaera sp.]|nr:hypothetical protein [Phycisphaera sp.]